MKKRNIRRVPCLLVILGLIMAMISMIALCGTPDSLQYTVARPKDVNDLRQALMAKENAAEQLGDCTSAVAVGAVRESESVSAGETSKSAVVYAVGEGWFEVYPVFMIEGQRLTETQLRLGERAALLDKELAFALFGSEIPENAKVLIGETEYSVAGTIRHRRSVGETQQYCVYVPLLADATAQQDVVMMAAKPIPDTGAPTMFENVVRSGWRSDGCFYNIQKETLRQMMLPRMLLLIFGIGAIVYFLRCMKKVACARIERYREILRWHYFRETVPALLGTILICLLGYAAILGLLYGLIVFSVHPLTVFTEWVPENFVKWSSLKNVFWNLTNDAAELVKVGSREMRQVEFWGRILRWSVIAVLSGSILMHGSRRFSKE